MIPFDKIYENEDRSWSLRLVRHLASAPEADLYDVWETLEHLADPRTMQPLSELLFDKEQTLDVREVASRVLSSFEIDVAADKRKDWWQSGDPILMAHAVRVASYAEADLIEQIASNCSVNCLDLGTEA